MEGVANKRRMVTINGGLGCGGGERGKDKQTYHILSAKECTFVINSFLW